MATHDQLTDDQQRALHVLARADRRTSAITDPYCRGREDARMWLRTALTTPDPAPPIRVWLREGPGWGCGEDHIRGYASVQDQADRVLKGNPNTIRELLGDQTTEMLTAVPGEPLPEVPAQPGSLPIAPTAPTDPDTWVRDWLADNDLTLPFDAEDDLKQALYLLLGELGKVRRDNAFARSAHAAAVADLDWWKRRASRLRTEHDNAVAALSTEIGTTDRLATEHTRLRAVLDRIWDIARDGGGTVRSDVLAVLDSEAADRD